MTLPPAPREPCVLLKQSDGRHGQCGRVGDRGGATERLPCDGDRRRPESRYIPVKVVAQQLGPQTVDANGGVVQSTDGTEVQIAAGALTAGTTVQIAPHSIASIPEGPHNGIQVNAAAQLSQGSQTLALPAQLAIPVPTGVPVGTKVYVYLATTLPDDTGSRGEPRLARG